MLNLNDLRFFVVAVAHGGFAAAGRALGVPKSTVSKRVAELEQALQARLLYRSSRSFTLTDAGRDFYDHARAALIEAEAAQEAVQRRVAEPSGTVRITAAVPTAQHYLAPHLPALARAYPRLHVQLEVSDRMVDLVQEGFDIAVRSHFAPLPDSGLVQRQLAVEDIVLVASPGYLAERGTPEAPAQLSGHDGLLTGAAAGTWRLWGPGGARAEASPAPRMTVNESTVLLGAAIAGLGIVPLPHALCRAALAAGRLARVLPQWTAGSVTTTLLLPARRGQLPGVRATVDFLVQCLAPGGAGQVVPQ
ncbi:LysR substrate-binding domain-containing protein [Cupriavidus taiwanensis]|uniref:Transcriptional regulator, LysR family n=1 Tax=Cupriavidus taiwanensis TaxID=164546 RepID=A0A375IDA0_9BURK|nr:LysR substrate-binding domain-containing protein [Cupriavidus taiwanensis]SOY48917.1 Transcriptional regulator, LysR family [Cupriavidus taiwanensis]SOY49045.1 Transcriptional regulator, LysR family [Cupriavidus taiwanensis]SOY83248.1 Transcriptional regulator, LysR family [Cupriavidus taiwanensis]SOZ23264.1 Transcriptional regulator, LysR family [Cupriavidus taiwanensis]SOZ57231.1 Transcriptional regulator, LysR family [Cupriavidus taiwanensis]